MALQNLKDLSEWAGNHAKKELTQVTEANTALKENVQTLHEEKEVLIFAKKQSDQNLESIKSLAEGQSTIISTFVWIITLLIAGFFVYYLVKKNKK